MGRASTTLLLALPACLALGIAGYWWLRGVEPAAPPGQGEGGSDPAAARGPELAAAAPRVWVDVEPIGTIRPPPSPPRVLVRRGEQALPAAVTVLGGGTQRAESRAAPD